MCRLLIDEDGNKFMDFFRAKVTDNRGQQRNPEESCNAGIGFFIRNHYPLILSAPDGYIFRRLMQPKFLPMDLLIRRILTALKMLTVLAILLINGMRARMTTAFISVQTDKRRNFTKLCF